MSLTFRIPFELVAVADGRQSTQLIGTMVTLDYESMFQLIIFQFV